ncbi:hypothetical protein RN001_001183 [Aquatica leii]|uniref:MYND-type domain-containing protein n=1 Tax=Aquatica leii TaxID=1421715 RepID=A0AAN7SJH0_9COLE|nr:hypothetical protein RN001_001183 [Aquatica leii]
MDGILLSTEIDLYIDTMQPQKMENIGTKNWLEWHQRLQKLNQQAVIEAATVSEEYVKEALITFGKVSVLVHEAILINIWKYKVFPILLRLEDDPPITFIAYSVLYHEAVCVALLELIMYHGNTAEALGEIAADLLNYVYGTVSQLLTFDENEDNQNNDKKPDLIRQKDDLSFDIGIRSLTILRYLADYLDRLPLAITARIFGINDVPVLLTQIILQKPWIKEGKEYNGGKWKDWDGESVPKVEAQIWLALRQLLLDAACLTHYNITESRKAQLMKLQPYLSPSLVDQISPLIELQQWLYRLAVTDQSCAPNKPIVLEVMLDIQNNIIAQCQEKWKKIARAHLPIIFSRNREELVETAQFLNEAYNTDLLEKLETINDVPQKNCAGCGKNAMQRCSRCKNIWYCSRNCQVNHWSDHKAICCTA